MARQGLAANAVQGKGWLDVLPHLLLAAAAAIPLRWRLRINEQGVARRRLLRWDLWPWEDFESGRIEKRHANKLYDPRRPLLRRWMTLGYMERKDLDEAYTIINARYELPPPPAVPDSLTIKYGFRRRATFDRQGVQLTKGKTRRHFNWDEVRWIEFVRMDPLRRDFASLAIGLPDDELELKYVSHQGGTSTTWSGATAEELNELLFRIAPPGLIDVLIAGEPPTRPEQIGRRLAAVKRKTRELKIICVVACVLLPPCLVWLAIGGQVLAAVMMGLAHGAMIGGVAFFSWRSLRSQASGLEDALSAARARAAG